MGYLTKDDMDLSEKCTDTSDNSVQMADWLWSLVALAMVVAIFLR